MKKTILIVAAMSLSACMGGGGDDVEVSLGSDFGTLLNNTRTASDLNLDSRLTSAAQTHATDMFTRDYDSIVVMGETVIDPADGLERDKDIGDLVTEAGYSWMTIKELIAKGEFTNSEALAVWNGETCSGGVRCYDDAAYEDFGIAKAGSGSDQRWVLILATENP
ncbi:MAG: hypothetical protein AAFN63_04785 [Pseudomonadota bacterium]